jgi:septal ring factor EnvC (AmiA/AmiB activator)
MRACQPKEDTMKKHFAPILAALALAAAPVIADDRPEHYKGEPSATLEEAFANLAEYNTRLRTILDKGEVQGDDFNEIHRLTYTLENALGRIEDELEELEDDLEEIHQASEKGDSKRIDKYAPRYFDRAEQLLQAAGD